MDLILLFFIFVLAAFLGLELISKVPSQLHTPLMSGSNAISGITIVGALLAIRADEQGTHLESVVVKPKDGRDARAQLERDGHERDEKCKNGVE